MARILAQIEHVVVVMLENRSFDNMCGWLYRNSPPAHFLPASTSSRPFQGLRSGLFNPVDESYFASGSGQTWSVFDRANVTDMPNPDPEEAFDDVTYQLFGPEGANQNPKWPNLGFVIDYKRATGANTPVQIMEPFAPDQIPVDEHGGTYDHVMPPWGAACPDNASDSGEEGFTFNRFGIRVPMIAVSPWIQAETVFRSDSLQGVPYDHTSTLATLRDWLGIPADKMLTSKRIAAAPNLAQIVTLAEARNDLPDIPSPSGDVKQTAMSLPPNKLQQSLVSAEAVRRGHDPVTVLKAMQSRAQAHAYLTSNPSE
jgi:phospholipase C